MQLSQFQSLIKEMPVKHQASTAKKDTWKKHSKGGNNAAKALQAIFDKFCKSQDVILSRNDIFGLAEAGEVEQLVMATLIWGYPRSMRGNHVKYLIGQFDQLTHHLRASCKQPETTWADHAKVLKSIRSLGPSTYTKLLYFLKVQVDGHPALILDSRIIAVIEQRDFEELKELKFPTPKKRFNDVDHYPKYLECMYRLAEKFNVDADKIEFFLFEFGLNLKQPPHP